MSRKSKTSKEPFLQNSYGSIDLPMFNDIETDISELDFSAQDSASGVEAAANDSGFVEEMPPRCRSSSSDEFFFDAIPPKKHMSEISLTESAGDCCDGAVPKSLNSPDGPPDKKIRISPGPASPTATTKAKALCLLPAQLEEFSVEDLNRHLDFLKLFAEGVSNELVVLLQERDWLQNQVEVRYAFIEQLLKLQHDPDSAHYRAHLETRGVQMSVVT